jgi:hypothetical protein
MTGRQLDSAVNPADVQFRCSVTASDEKPAKFASEL